MSDRDEKGGEKRERRASAMEVEKRDGATRSAVLGTRKLPACLPAACLLASHPKFPSRYVYAYICVRPVDATLPTLFRR